MAELYLAHFHRLNAFMPLLLYLVMYHKTKWQHLPCLLWNFGFGASYSFAECYFNLLWIFTVYFKNALFMWVLFFQFSFVWVNVENVLIKGQPVDSIKAEKGNRCTMATCTYLLLFWTWEINEEFFYNYCLFLWSASHSEPCLVPNCGLSVFSNPQLLSQ